MAAGWPPHGVGGCDAACRWGATQAVVLPGPGSLTEPFLLRVPLASPGPRHPAEPSALQPRRSTATRHSTAGPTPLLMHMQPYSGLYSHSQTHQQQTHTSYKPKKLWEMALYHHHSLWAQQARRKTLANNRTLTHASRSRRPPTIPL